jgi:hypothetical protein
VRSVTATVLAGIALLSTGCASVRVGIASRPSSAAPIGAVIGSVAPTAPSLDDLSQVPIPPHELAMRLITRLSCPVGIGLESPTDLQCLGGTPATVETHLSYARIFFIMASESYGGATVVIGVAPPDDRWAAVCACPPRSLATLGGTVVVRP